MSTQITGVDAAGKPREVLTDTAGRISVIGTIVAAASDALLTAIAATLASRLLTDGGPWAYADPVTPSDTVDLPNMPARGLRAITAGTVKYEMLRSDGATRYAVTETLAAGAVLPVAVYRVYATGTSATLFAGF
jgi:hypothetical protein